MEKIIPTDRHHRWCEVIALSIIPAFFFILTLILIQIPGGFVGDPDYSVLTSALNILYFHAPGQLEHPGTPLHILGGVLLAIIWFLRLPFVAFASPQYDVLRHPEFYLYVSIR